MLILGQLTKISNYASVLTRYTFTLILQVYTRLNHLNVCLSYNATLTLIQDISKDHTLPLQKWIEDGVIFKFWSDNVDKKRKVRDIRSDHQGDMLHMYSILVGKSRTPEKSLAHTGVVASLKSQCSSSFLPSTDCEE